MKKTLTFIPLGVGISGAIIYIFNIIQFRVINNSATMLQILSNLKVYLYISIAGFITYVFVKILTLLNEKQNKIVRIENEIEENEIVVDDTYEPFEEIKQEITEDVKQEVTSDNQSNTYVPNYDYVPLYKEEKNLFDASDFNVLEEKQESIPEVKDEVKEIVIKGDKYCFNCGTKIFKEDRYCSYCGKEQYEHKKSINPILKNIINVLEIVILILILYFSLNMLFDYKASKDSSFTSPFKVSMTK